MTLFLVSGYNFQVNNICVFITTVSLISGSGEWRHYLCKCQTEPENTEEKKSQSQAGCQRDQTQRQSGMYLCSCLDNLALSSQELTAPHFYPDFYIYISYSQTSKSSKIHTKSSILGHTNVEAESPSNEETKTGTQNSEIPFLFRDINTDNICFISGDVECEDNEEHIVVDQQC